jgi:hypothetical protein
MLLVAKQEERTGLRKKRVGIQHTACSLSVSYVEMERRQAKAGVMLL